MTQFPFEASTEYRNAYSWKNKPQNEEKDIYEAVVEKMMQEQFQSSDSKKKAIEEDPYELIVQRKMNEPLKDEPNKKTNIQTNIQTNKHEQKLDHLESSSLNNGRELDQCSVSSRNSAGSRGSVKTKDLTEDNLSISSGSGRLSGKKDQLIKKKVYDVSHLNQKKSTLTEQARYTGHIRPVFLRDPDHATEEEKKHLYGPFYVSWPKNKAMPAQYAELQKVYHKHHY